MLTIRRNIKLLSMSFVVILFSFTIALSPSIFINAAKSGVLLWFNSVFPSLFPFLICCNLLIGLGAVNFLGVFFEPLMKPIFNVSGKGAFAFLMGILSGYPMGAKIISDLRQKNDLSRTESIRLMSFCNNSGPLFIIGAVGVAMLGDLKIGYFMLIVSYAAAISTGLIFRFYKYSEQISHDKLGVTALIRKAFFEQKKARRKDGRSFGVLLSDSVKNSMDISVQIGGFIILFSVIVCALKFSGALDGLYSLIQATTGITPDKNIYEGIFVGALEITNAVSIVSGSGVDISLQAAACVCIIAWGGLSIHAQTISIINKTDISVSLYLLAKLINAAFALLYALLLLPVLKLFL